VQDLKYIFLFEFCNLEQVQIRKKGFDTKFFFEKIIMSKKAIIFVKRYEGISHM